jgi:hypothetical protein
MVMKHDAGCLGRLALRMADVEAFDAQLLDVFGLEAERLDQRTGA